MATTKQRLTFVALCSMVASLAATVPAHAFVDGKEANDENISQSIARVTTLYPKDGSNGSSGDGSSASEQLHEVASREGGASTEDFKMSLCTGTLIDPSWVVTAKHCVNKDGAVSAVTFGVEVGDSPINVDSVVEHPDSDVALLHLEKQASGTPVKIWDQGNLRSATDGDVFGWGGLGESGEGKSALTLTQARATMDSKITKDRGLVKGMETIEAKILDGAKSTRGDSGAPFVMDGKVYGLLSQGVVDRSESPHSTTTTLFTPLQSYAKWINETTEQDLVSGSGGNQGATQGGDTGRSRGGDIDTRSDSTGGFATTDNGGRTQGNGANKARGTQGSGKSKANAFAMGKNAQAKATAKPGHAKSSARAGGEMSPQQWKRIHDSLKKSKDSSAQRGNPGTPSGVSKHIAVANAQANS